jgi:putative MATE family efflux protein
LPFKNINKDNLHFRLFAIATPIIVQNLVHYLQLQVDMAMIGRYDTHLLSAVGNVIFPYNIIISFLTAISAGATVMISHSYGGKLLVRAKRFAEVSFFYNILFSLPLFIFMFTFSHHLMTWMGTSEQVNANATIFMKYLSFSVLFLGVELSIVSILQGVGKTRAIMVAGIICTVGNIFLDWTLIYGHLGFPSLGIRGAAIATSTANFLGMGYLVINYTFTKRLPFKTSLKGIFNPRWSIQKQNVAVGWPHGLESIFWSFGQIIIVRMVNEIDELSAGIYVLITRIQSVTFFFYLGIAKATMIIAGQEAGSGNPKKAAEIGYLSLKYAFASCIVAAGFFILYPQALLSLFTSDKTLIMESAYLLNIVTITIFPVAVNVVIGNAIRGMKDTRWMFYTQAFGTFFVITLSGILLFVFHSDLRAIFITVLFDELIRAYLNFNRFRGYANKV